MAKWRSLCSVAVAVAAVLAGLYAKSEADTRRECSQKPELTRHLEKYVAPGPKSALDPWPMKLGDLQRTSRSNFTATSKLRQPRWSFYWPSMHYNSPLVDRFGNIYAISTAGNAFSLDPNGKFRWHFQVIPGACNPAFQDGVLFTFTNGVIFALDMETGQPRWVQKVAERGSAGNEGIAVGEGLVIAHYHIGHTGWTDEAAFVAVDVATGAEVWRTRVDSNYFNVIIAFADGGSSLVFTDMNGGTFKLDTHTGQHIWSAPGFPFPLTQQALWFDSAHGAPRSHSALALVDQQRGIVYSGGNPTRSTGRVRALSLETGKELWERNVDKMLGNNGALAEIAGVPTLVLGSGVPCQHPIPESRPPFRGTVYGLHAETGRILWRFQTRPWDGVAAAGTVFNKRCPQANLPDAFNSPTIDGSGTVFIGWHGGVVYALDGRDGTLLSQYEAGEGPQGQTAVGPSGELIVIGARWLHAFWPEDQ